MALANTFFNTVVDVVRNPLIADGAIEMAREVGLRVDQRAPGVEFGLQNNGPSLGL